jgi:hypothetical protein
MQYLNPGSMVSTTQLSVCMQAPHLSKSFARALAASQEPVLRSLLHAGSTCLDAACGAAAIDCRMHAQLLICCQCRPLPCRQHCCGAIWCCHLSCLKRAILALAPPLAAHSLRGTGVTGMYSVAPSPGWGYGAGKPGAAGSITDRLRCAAGSMNGITIDAHSAASKKEASVHLPQGCTVLWSWHGWFPACR